MVVPMINTAIINAAAAEDAGDAIAVRDDRAGRELPFDAPMAYAWRIRGLETSRLLLIRRGRGHEWDARL